MLAKKLYQYLEKDFINPNLIDAWYLYMEEISEFICDNFKKRSIGLVCDFTTEINYVYTAVFPSNLVMNKIIKEGKKNSLLFVHHPATWDIRKAPKVFEQMNNSLLKKFKKQKISIYTLHSPLDNFGHYSTSVSLAKALDITTKKAFALENGALNGIIGKSNYKNIDQLKEYFEKMIKHKVSLYDYGDSDLVNKNIAVIAGGGNDPKFLKEAIQNKAQTFITGITAKNDHSKKAHQFAKENKINILGGTHYSTEMFACLLMLNYFKNKKISSKFISDKPVLEDL
jgi:putative NIF3 family GTP cyclohydrolase 1 type 2